MHLVLSYFAEGGEYYLFQPCDQDLKVKVLLGLPLLNFSGRKNFPLAFFNVHCLEKSGYLGYRYRQLLNLRL